MAMEKKRRKARRMEISFDDGVSQVRVLDIALHPNQDEIIIGYEVMRCDFRTANNAPFVEAPSVSRWHQKVDMENRCPTVRPATSMNGLHLDIRIHLDDCGFDEDASLWAKQIVEDCPILKNKHIPAVETLLREKLNRACSPAIERLRALSNDLDFEDEGDDDYVEIGDLEHCLERLYEEDDITRIHAARCIARLFCEGSHLEKLMLHDSLLAALSRTIQEEGKSNIELAANILTCFASISEYPQLHAVIIEHKMGSTAMTLLDYIINQITSPKKRPLSSKGDTVIDFKSPSITVTNSHEHGRDRASNDAHVVQLISSSLHLLLNLSRDMTLEKKIVHRGVVGLLVPLLDVMHHEQVLKLSLFFLTRLATYQYTEQLRQSTVVASLVKFLNSVQPKIKDLARRLAYNMSFDSILQDAMMGEGYLSHVNLQSPDLEQNELELKILYQFSIQDNHKSLFTYSGILVLLMEMTLAISKVDVKENAASIFTLLSLLVNLAQNETNSEVMTADPFLEPLIQMAMADGHPLLFKVYSLEMPSLILAQILRNVSQHENQTIKRRFLPFLDALIATLWASETSEDVQVEIAGCLANINIDGVDYFDVLVRHEIVDHLEPLFSSLDTEDDLLLELVMWIGVLCCERTSFLIAKSTLVDDLVETMETKKEDAEMLLQLTFTVEQLLQQEATRTVLYERTPCMDRLIAAWLEDDTVLSGIADRCLDVFMSSDQRWREIIRLRKFEAYNEAWIERAFTIHEQIHDLDGCLRRSSSGLKKLIEETISSDDDIDPARYL